MEVGLLVGGDRVEVPMVAGVLGYRLLDGAPCCVDRVGLTRPSRLLGVEVDAYGLATRLPLCPSLPGLLPVLQLGH